MSQLNVLEKFEEPEGDQSARDSLRILPLSSIPLENAALQQARIVKNSHLKGVVEMFQGKNTGIGQLEPDQLPTHFGWNSKGEMPDVTRIRALSTLSSYDVYSLRIELRRLGIDVNDHKALTLSEEKNKELAGYMKSFTGPLLQEVYGSENTDIGDFNQLVSMFASPDRAEAQRNLEKLANKLEISLFEVPAFLEDYADTFLSLAYYKDCMAQVVPDVVSFLEKIGDLKTNLQLKRTPGFVETCDFMEPRLNNIITSITKRFERFDQHSDSLWDNISAGSFKRVQTMIKSHHTTVGGVLCGLTTKMDAWDDAFGNLPEGAAVVRRAEFIMSNMRHGIEHLEQLEKSAPSFEST